MAHQVSEEYLYGENINEYFRILAVEIHKAGIGRHKILVVGGAAMALKYHDGRSTVDIDICFIPGHMTNTVILEYASPEEMRPL